MKKKSALQKIIAWAWNYVIFMVILACKQVNFGPKIRFENRWPHFITPRAQLWSGVE